MQQIQKSSPVSVSLRGCSFLFWLFYCGADLLSLDSQQQWISHALSCFKVYQVLQKNDWY